MSIRVLDPNGRVLRPISLANAKSKVKHSHAKWLHAQGVEPDRKHGTIILKNDVKNPPAERVQTQVYNANGQFFAWIWPEMAIKVLEKKQCSMVGTNMLDGPRAVIVPRLVSKAAMKELHHIAARRTVDAAIHRDFLRKKILQIARENHTWDDIEEEVYNFTREHLSLSKKEEVLSEFRQLRRKIVTLDLVFGPDMGKARHELVSKCRR